MLAGSSVCSSIRLSLRLFVCSSARRSVRPSYVRRGQVRWSSTDVLFSRRAVNGHYSTVTCDYIGKPGLLRTVFHLSLSRPILLSVLEDYTATLAGSLRGSSLGGDPEVSIFPEIKVGAIDLTRNSERIRNIQRGSARILDREAVYLSVRRETVIGRPVLVSCPDN